MPLAEKAGIIRYAIGVRPLPRGSLRLRLHLTHAERLVGSSSAASLPQVGDAFQEPTAREELNTIGSVPSQDHVFKVDNFAALSSIQKQLQEKIFAVEGKYRASLGLGIQRFPTRLFPTVLRVHPYSHVTQNCAAEPETQTHSSPSKSLWSHGPQSLSGLFSHRNPVEDK